MREAPRASMVAILAQWTTDSAGSPAVFKDEFALFQINNSGDFHLFISDSNDGVTASNVLTFAGDRVVQLAGMTGIRAIDLTGAILLF